MVRPTRQGLWAILGGSRPTRLHSLLFTRSLFRNFKGAPKLKIEDDDSHHNEYSIRPDTFAFKVSGAPEKTHALAQQQANGPEAHPLQKDRSRQSPRFNAVEFIYKNTTNYPFATRSPQDVYNTFPSTNSAKLARSKHRPTRVKMLASDFIEDSLYNPHYGYFSLEVEIFHPDKPFDYNNIDDVDAFMDLWQQAYRKYDDESPQKRQKQHQAHASKKPQGRFAAQAQKIHSEELASTGQFKKTKRLLQLWHTPTELFLPYYGEALARYLLVNYKLNGNYPYNDLIIYEMGGGNGTLMCNVLHYIKENEPDIYARTHYKIIEILSQLALKQYKSALGAKLTLQGLDAAKLEIINQSIFAWDKTVDEPCFFIALEVFDNFSHDVVRYDNTTGIPHEGHVLVDEHGDFYEFFTPELSYYTNAFLQLRENGNRGVLKNASSWSASLQTALSTLPFTQKDKIHPLYHSSTKLRWKNSILPFKDNLTPAEFVPTRLLQFFQILKHRFPNHSLVCSDFNSLPKAIPGYYNAPVVQTVLQNRMIDVSTYMCHQGYFDIMFPTDFGLASDLYKQVTGKVPRVELHKDFLEQWADIDVTTTRKGENPMLDFYTNVSFMVS